MHTGPKSQYMTASIHNPRFKDRQKAIGSYTTIITHYVRPEDPETTFAWANRAGICPAVYRAVSGDYPNQEALRTRIEWIEKRRAEQ